MSRIRLVASALVTFHLMRAQSHSWVACTDYRGSMSTFQQEKCYGWPRNYRPIARVDGYQIAVPDSRAYSNGGCDVTMAKGGWQRGYSSEYPFAKYEPGEVYCVAWPMKNHGWLPESCQNQQSKSDAGINDTLHLYVSSVNPENDPSQSGFYQRNINELAGLASNCNPEGAYAKASLDECQLGLESHENYQPDCKGFLRAPKFCESSGMSMGTGCFKIPENMSLGHYVAQWRWQTSFIRGEGFQTQAYMSCFDFEIVAAGSLDAYLDSPGTKGTPDSSLPCQNNVLKFRPDNSPVIVPSTTSTTSPSSGSICVGPHEVCATPSMSPKCCLSGYTCAYHKNSGYARCLPASDFPIPAHGQPEPESESESMPSTGGTSCVGDHAVCDDPSMGPTCCITGYTCAYYRNSGYARCLPSSEFPIPAQPNPEVEPVLDSDTEIQPQPEPEPELEPATEAQPQAEPEPEPESAAEPAAQLEPAGEPICKQAHEHCATPGQGASCCVHGYECVFWQDSGYARCRPSLHLREISKHQDFVPQKRTFLARGQVLLQGKGSVRKWTGDASAKAEL